MTKATQLKATPIPIYDDNYVWVLQHSDSRSVIIVDPGSAKEVVEYLAEHKLTIRAVIITHSHWDHVTGLPELTASKHLWSADQPVIYGPASIAAVTRPVSDGEIIPLWEHSDLPPLNVIATPGHMPEHLAYFLPSEQPMVFCGDTLFSCGCGRIFKGTHEELRTSLNTLANLPLHTEVYCTHEYTLANIEFALAVEPHSKAIHAYKKATLAKRNNNAPSLPTQIALEKSVNPFLRYKELSVRQAVENHLELKDLSEQEIFKQLRLWKDRF